MALKNYDLDTYETRNPFKKGGFWNTASSRREFAKWQNEIIRRNPDILAKYGGKKTEMTRQLRLQIEAQGEKVFSSYGPVKDDYTTLKAALTTLNTMEVEFPGIIDWASIYIKSNHKDPTRTAGAGGPKKRASILGMLMSVADNDLEMNELMDLAGFQRDPLDGRITSNFQRQEADPEFKADLELEIKAAAEARAEVEKEAKKAKGGDPEEAAELLDQQIAKQKAIEHLVRQREEEDLLQQARLYPTIERTLLGGGKIDKDAARRNELRRAEQKKSKQRRHDIEVHGEELTDEDRRDTENAMTRRAVAAADLQALVNERKRYKKSLHDVGGKGFGTVKEDKIRELAEFIAQDNATRLQGKNPLEEAALQSAAKEILALAGMPDAGLWSEAEKTDIEQKSGDTSGQADELHQKLVTAVMLAGGFREGFDPKASIQEQTLGRDEAVDLADNLYAIALEQVEREARATSRGELRPSRTQLEGSERLKEIIRKWTKEKDLKFYRDIAQGFGLETDPTKPGIGVGSTSTLDPDSIEAEIMSPEDSRFPGEGRGVPDIDHPDYEAEQFGRLSGAEKIDWFETDRDTFFRAWQMYDEMPYIKRFDFQKQTKDAIAKQLAEALESGDERSLRGITGVNPTSDELKDAFDNWRLSQADALERVIDAEEALDTNFEKNIRPAVDAGLADFEKQELARIDERWDPEHFSDPAVTEGAGGLDYSLGGRIEPYADESEATLAKENIKQDLVNLGGELQNMKHDIASLEDAAAFREQVEAERAEQARRQALAAEADDAASMEYLDAFNAEENQKLQQQQLQQQQLQQQQLQQAETDAGASMEYLDQQNAAEDAELEEQLRQQRVQEYLQEQEQLDLDSLMREEAGPVEDMLAEQAANFVPSEPDSMALRGMDLSPDSLGDTEGTNEMAPMPERWEGSSNWMPTPSRDMSPQEQWSGGLQTPSEFFDEKDRRPLLPEPLDPTPPVETPAVEPFVPSVSEGVDPAFNAGLLTPSTSMSTGPQVFGREPDEPTLPYAPTEPFVPTVSEGVDPAFNAGLTLDDVVEPLPEPAVHDNDVVREVPNTVIADANKTTDVYNTPTPDAFGGYAAKGLSPFEIIRQSRGRPYTKAELADIKRVQDAEDQRISKMTSETVGGMPLSKEERADEVTRKYALEDMVPSWTDLDEYDPYKTSFGKYKRYGQSSEWPIPWFEPEIKSGVTKPYRGGPPEPREGFSTPGGHPGPRGLEGLEGPMGPQGYIPHPSSMGEREGALGFRSALRKRKNPVLINVFDDNAFA